MCLRRAFLRRQGMRAVENGKKKGGDHGAGRTGGAEDAAETDPSGRGSLVATSGRGSLVATSGRGRAAASRRAPSGRGSAGTTARCGHAAFVAFVSQRRHQPTGPRPGDSGPTGPRPGDSGAAAGRHEDLPRCGGVHRAVLLDSEAGPLRREGRGLAQPRRRRPWAVGCPRPGQLRRGCWLRPVGSPLSMVMAMVMVMVLLMVIDR